MLDPGNDLVPSSPSISDVSSSDLDTESTGSFFHDRSTTLGTLMGVSFRSGSFRVSSQRENSVVSASSAVTGGASANTGGGGNGGGRKSSSTKKGKNKPKKKKVMVVAPTATERRGRWWRLCRDDSTRPSSLGDFLEVERRFGDGAFYGAAEELEEGVVAPSGNGRVLFADGRVLPPTQAVATPPTAGTNCRFPVLLSGICSGGGG
ncbi:PREDICTED: uncharacterized protein At3g17950 [Nelumbo nucifera]|uniref:Uncharacterized protein n=2 Tax=Nelumbo nucifera TaxID=4432 RepID=A0A822YI45_NELNU|nr:PREDICTED: uncharacterized protein At3g17950 [Nelumbo nucifera]DAD32142.1 TPA_asm: hypothetical protein HUJ06_010993 [Nelumbo nucifera]